MIRTIIGFILGLINQKYGLSPNFAEALGITRFQQKNQFLNSQASIL